jgi:hypothetical protein
MWDRKDCQYKDKMPLDFNWDFNLPEEGLSDRILFGFMLRLFILIYGPQSKPQTLFAGPIHYT